MAIQFSQADLQSPDRLERVLRLFDSAISNTQATVAAMPKPAATTPSVPSKPSSAAPASTAAQQQSLLIPAAGVTVVQTPTQTVIQSSGVTSITGTAHEIIVSNPSGDTVLSTPQPIDTTSAVQFGSLNLSSLFNVNSSGLPTQSDGIALVGQGFALIVASGNATGQTGAVSSVTSYTTPNAACSFEIGGYINVTAFVAGTISLQCDYVDPSGASKTLVIPLVALAGTISTTVGSLTDAQAVVVSVQTSTAAAIKIYTTVSLLSATYSVYAWIKRIS